jgi:TrmH family RNA methyltransferase
LVAPAESDRLRVVLVRTRNPLNIGAAARAMSNFGFRRLRVVNPFEVAFREARSAVGASDVLLAAEQYKSVAEAVSDCALVVGTTALWHRELRHPLLQVEEAADLIREKVRSGNAALLFGSEKVGLSNADLSHCHRVLRIPTHEAHASMNLGQAVAVCLYEIARSQPPESLEPEAQLATAEQVERFTETLFLALRLSGYVKPGSEKSTETKVRRLVHRVDTSSADMDVWLGMLRQIVWKLKAEE